MADDRSKSASLRKWRGASSPVPEAAHGTGRAGAVFRLLAVMAVVAAVAVGLMFYLRGLDEPVFRSIAVREYDSPLYPCNAWAEQDSDALLRYFPNPQSRKAYDSQTHSMLGGELKNVVAAKKKEPLVVHVSAHAVCRDGNVEILPGDARPDDDAKRLSLRALLDSLRAAESENKLLILDIMRPIADARLGILKDDIAARVHEELGHNDDAHLQVLCSCSPGQIALAAHGLRQSVFGHFIEQGLAGAADGQNLDHQTNDRVSVHELAKYVRTRVDRWAADRLTRQTPVLVGRANDFELTSHAASAGEPPGPDPFPFKDAWKTHANWRADDSHFRLPRHYRQLQAYLLRAEDRWMGGVNVDRARSELAEKINDLEKQRKEVLEWMKTESRPAGELDPNALEALKLDPKALEAPKATLKKLESIAPPKTKEGLLDRVKLTEEAHKLRAELPPALLTGPGLSLLERMLLNELAEDPNPIWVKIQFAHRLLSGLPRPSRPRGFALLARLAPLETDPEIWPKDAVRTAFRIARQVDELSNQEPWTLPWVRSGLQRATTATKRGEDLLFVRSDWEKAFPESLRQLEQAERDYQLIPPRIKALIQVRNTCDDALAFLPEYPNYLFALAGPPPVELEEEWGRALDLCGSIDDQLTPPAGAGTADARGDVESEINKLAQQAERLRSSIDRLKQPFMDHALTDLIERCPSWDTEPMTEIDPNLYWQLKAILRTPFPAGDMRVKLWDALQRVDRLLQHKAEKNTNTASVPLGSFDSERTKWDQRETERGKLRLRLSLRLFAWGGLESQKLAKARSLLQQIEGDPTDRGAWDDLGKELRRLWGQILIDELKDTRDPRKRLRLGRIICPLDADPVSATGRADRYPAAALRMQQINDAKAFFKQLVD